MESLFLRVRAPFAAFRVFQAGVYRATAPAMPHSAALGLVLNLAGIEMRGSLNEPTTLIRPDVPRLRIAIGSVTPPERASLYQQLHTYPIGADAGKHLKPMTYGAKYWIVPTRRELLVNLDALIGVRAPQAPDLLERVVRGLCGELEAARYGLPFAGDNNFMFDRVDVCEEPPPATRWYTPVETDQAPRKGSWRLTIDIDRADNSRTTSLLFAPTAEGTAIPPASAWVWTPRPPDEA
jgi:CRISPR-associated protein Cas5t